MLRMVGESSTTSTRLGSRSRAQRSISALACSTSAGLTTTPSAPCVGKALRLLHASRPRGTRTAAAPSTALARCSAARSAAGIAASIKTMSMSLAAILARAAAALSASTMSTGTDATPAPRRIRSRSAAEAEHSRIRRKRESPLIVVPPTAGRTVAPPYRKLPDGAGRKLARACKRRAAAIVPPADNV